MIFVGDIAVPDATYSKQLQDVFLKHSSIFKDEDLIINLEGLINDSASTNHKTPHLFNHSSVVKVLSENKTKFAGLANNHTLDFPDFFSDTVRLLKKNNIEYGGAGNSVEEADKPAIIETNGKKSLVFNHCWHVMLQHQNNPSAGVYVSTIKEKKMIEDIGNYRKEYPEANIIVYLHWSFDLETLPFPLHRQFSRALIDAGANLVVGCHSHCIQGGEQYKKGYIIYGLGNFFVPWYTYINGNLHFPEFARIEMAFEWEDQTNEAICHFFKYESSDDYHFLEHLETATFDESRLLRKYSPYQGMNENNYIDYYRKHRRKKGGIPIYKDYRSTFKNNLNDFLVMKRMRIARFLAENNLIEWNK